ncbi:MAG TPA: serine/threonine-protein kinase [Chiayiivirga sp.]|nr:serine/threonine-protein kinase [Chiayiivirga sp.]
MTDAHVHARVVELFHVLSELPPAEQEARLAQLEPELQERLRSLLRADQANTSALTQVLQQASTSALTPSTPGLRLGPWRIVRELGAGGMGSVLLAERADGQFEQQVAIKLIRGFPTADGQRRLRQERQILAQLDHPNIAHLIDGGQADDGQPYVVMEYVQGLGLLEHVAVAGLSLDARLSLFDHIADAVQHAHQRLVIHRDLKPGNILVQANGEPKLLDFGVAKLVDMSVDTERETSTRVFSQGYASPEQIAGRMVSTTTDVYALGVILREMLTGERGPGLAVTAPPGFQALSLPSDLRGVIEQATDEDPARRYATVEALRADVARWRSGLPVRAAADTWRYRAGKFVRRHRLGVGVVVVALVAAATFVWRLNVERHRALEAEAASAKALVAAERSEQAAMASLAFLTNTLSSVHPDMTLSKEITVRDLLGHMRSSIDADTTLSPRVRQIVQRLLGKLYYALGDPASAVSLLDLGLEGIEPAGRAEALALAEDLDSLSSALAVVERDDDALHRAQQAQDLREKFAPDDALQAMLSRQQMAYVHYRSGDAARAQTEWDALLADAERAPVPPEDLILNVYQSAAAVAHAQGEVSRALALADRGMAFAKEHGFNVERPSSINLLQTRAELLVETGKVDEAVGILRSLVALQERTVGLTGPRASNVLNALGIALNTQGQYREAAELFARGLDADGDAKPTDQERAIGLSNLASVEESAGDYVSALRHFDAAIALIDALPDTPDYMRINLQRNRARTLGLSGRHEEAKKALLGLRRRIAQEGEGNAANLAMADWQLSILAREAGDVVGGLQALDAALEGFKDVLPPEHLIYGYVHQQRAAFALQQHDLKLARSEIDAAIDALSGGKAGTVDVAIARSIRAAVRDAAGQRQAARDELIEVLPLLRQALLPTEVHRVRAERLARELGLSSEPAP